MTDGTFQECIDVTARLALTDESKDNFQFLENYRSMTESSCSVQT